MAIRYIGSKARLVDSLRPFIGAKGRRDGFFVEPFCGTGVVAEEAARQGWSVRLNDHLTSAVTMAAARMIPRRAARFRHLGGYASTLDRLNSLRSKRGFIWRQYSPAAEREVGVERKYFTEPNAGRIDAIRSQIWAWAEEEVISPVEERLLIADLLSATNDVANIAGTYGCFLSYWSPQAERRLTLTPREFFPGDPVVETVVGDASAVRVAPQDLVYLDPPYTKRQYAAYYHILETIALGDKPLVGGVTGLRPWRDKASDFCYRTRALRAIVRLIGALPARRILLSYSSEGHVPLEPLEAELSRIARVSVHDLSVVGRYRPNQAASDRGCSVNEYLLLIERTVAAERRMAIA